MTGAQDEVIAFLSTPASYGPGVHSVEQHKTHASIVFLAGERAYKLKRAVRYPYLDYSTVERRKAMCERELAVNRAGAPEIYLGVSAIVRQEAGTLRLAGEGEDCQAVDWVVVMRRLDEACLLDNMRADGRLTPSIARELGRVIAAYHGRAERMADRSGGAEIAAVLDENAAILARCDAIDPARAAQLDRNLRAALRKVRDLLDRRSRHGFVRRCHGDLHLNNICLIDGAPVLLDAIEFNDAFACIDVHYDLAFPVMELLRHNLVVEANALLNRYLELTGDDGGLSALPLFMSCRAAIRAHVALARRRAVGEPAEAKDLDDAHTLLDRAIAFLAPRQPRIIAVGGVSGTGKSTLAYALAPLVSPAPGAIVIRSDLTRKALLGVPETTRLAPEAYGPEMHVRVFESMAERARTVLKAGFPVILDGVYGEKSQRVRVAQLAAQSGVPFDGLWLMAAKHALEERIAARRGDASDATVAVLHRQLVSVSRPAEWRALDTGVSPQEVLAAARAALGIATLT